MKPLFFCKWPKKPDYHGQENHLLTSHLLHNRASTNILKIRNLILFTIIFIAFAQVCWGQAVGDFRSKGSDSWENPNNWEIWNGSTYAENTELLIPTSDNVIILSGHTVHIEATSSALNLTINSGGKLDFMGLTSLDITSNLVINGILEVKAGSILTVGGNTTLGGDQCLVIKCNSGKSGVFRTVSYNGTGTARVERFMSLTDNWHLYSSPVNQSYHDFILLNPQIPDLYIDNVYKGVGMRDYDTASDTWKANFNYQTGEPSGNVGGGKGFSIRGFTGNAPQTGYIYAIGTPYSSASVTLSTDNNRWNCIGNPFTAVINTSAFLAANSKFLQASPFDAIYIWDGSKNGYFPYNNSTNSNISIGQGFFVKSSSLGGTISFDHGMQINSANMIFKSNTLEWPSINIVAKNQTSISSTEIKFVTNTTKGLDPGYDAGMFKANPDFALYSKLLVDYEVDFSLQCLPDQNFDQYVIPIGIDFKAGGDLTFTAETVNLPSGCQAVLEDRTTKKFTRLDLKDAKYTATVSANTKGTGRFFLHTSDVISGDQPIEKEQFKINKIGKILYINGEVSDKANFFVYSVNGKQLANFKAESQVQNQFDASGFPAGVYILTIDDQNKKKSTKFIIEN